MLYTVRETAPRAGQALAPHASVEASVEASPLGGANRWEVRLLPAGGSAKQEDQPMRVSELAVSPPAGHKGEGESVLQRCLLENAELRAREHDVSQKLAESRTELARAHAEVLQAEAKLGLLLDEHARQRCVSGPSAQPSQLQDELRVEKHFRRVIEGVEPGK